VYRYCRIVTQLTLIYLYTTANVSVKNRRNLSQSVATMTAVESCWKGDITRSSLTSTCSGSRAFGSARDRTATAQGSGRLPTDFASSCFTPACFSAITSFHHHHSNGLSFAYFHTQKVSPDYRSSLHGFLSCLNLSLEPG
jgi:hypothetical protein